MQVLKRIVLAVGAIVILVLVVAIFLPSRTEVSRTIEVKNSVQQVFSFVSDYNNYAEWNVWSNMDPDAKSEIIGNPGEVGQTWQWQGNLIGKGTLTLKEIEPYNYIKGELVYITPMQGLADDVWKFEPLRESTRVIWSFETNLGYPLGRFFGLMMDSQLGPQLEEGLKNLKKAIESQPVISDSVSVQLPIE